MKRAFFYQHDYNSCMSHVRDHLGDDGKTGLLGNLRIPKYHHRLETLGDLDETSAALGLARALCRAPQTGSLLVEVQRDLYTVMTEIAITSERTQHFKTLDQARVDWLESKIEAVSTSLPIQSEFILPGDSLPGAALDMARTIVRRAERRVADLLDKNEIQNQILLQYLNRLSALCFALELLENRFSGYETTLAKK
jgi:cob(I)alamin adenosyltransferase